MGTCFLFCFFWLTVYIPYLQKYGYKAVIGFSCIIVTNVVFSFLILV